MELTDAFEEDYEHNGDYQRMLEYVQHSSQSFAHLVFFTNMLLARIFCIFNEHDLLFNQ